MKKSIVQINFEKLIVNKDNYRHDPVIDEVAAIHYHCNDGKMLELCESIIGNDFYSQSVFSVLISKEGELIALDGNRRLSALKILSNVEFVPFGKKYDKLRTFVIKNKIEPFNVNCVIYDKEEEAKGYIQAIHVSGISGAKTWDHVTQARFNQRWHNETSYWLKVLEQVFSPVPIITNATTLERVLKNRYVKKQLGINNDGTIKKDAIQKSSTVIKSIVKDINANAENSRTLNNAESIEKYLKNKIEDNNSSSSNRDIMPSISTDTQTYSENEGQIGMIENTNTVVDNISNNSDSDTVNTISSESIEAPDDTPIITNDNLSSPSESAQLTNTPLTIFPQEPQRRIIVPVEKTTWRKTLIPDHIVYETPYIKINDLVSELKKLNLYYFPNSIAITFRTFIELTLRYYAEINPAFVFIESNLPGMLGKVNNLLFVPKIKLSDEFKNIHSNIHAAVNNSNNITILNGIVHNLNVQVNREVLIDFYQTLMPLFNEIYK